MNIKTVGLLTAFILGATATGVHAYGYKYKHKASYYPSKATVSCKVVKYQESSKEPVYSPESSASSSESKKYNGYRSYKGYKGYKSYKGYKGYKSKVRYVKKCDDFSNG